MTADSPRRAESLPRAGSRFFAATALFLAAFVFTRFAQERWPEAPLALRAGLALLPAAAFLVFVLEQARFLRRADELERRIQVEALGFGFVLATALVMALGHLQQGGVLHGAPQETWAVIPLCYYIGLFRARRRYHP
jgi:hypothetical protein